jgi:exodeoxyribonuclease V beta subunit
MTAFDVNTSRLDGLNLIEASAGTGKTYTLSALYLRLVLEYELSVDQILVVTYTRAATEELRDRLRQKLVDARDELDSSHPDQRKQFHRLNLAIQSFDEAAIYTIHGFCQRVLADFAFESGLPFELELVGDDVELLQAATDDFWRRHVVQADVDFSAYLLACRESPESLLQSVRSLIGKPYLQVQPLPNFDVKQATQQLDTGFNRVKQLWNEQQDQVIAALTNKQLLNGNKYRSVSVEKWLLQLMALVELDDVPMMLFKEFERFTPAKLEDALKKDQVLPELSFWTACETLLEQHQQFLSVRELQLQQLRLDLLQYLTAELPEQKRQQQLQSYDDLLLNLDAALTGEQSEGLIEQLRLQYQAALIDEFQDTDPVQYASFSRIYANTGFPTFFVGDPKQAIYSFRGADIFTYLNAKTAAEHEHTLTTNWRSHPLLVSAVNTLFEKVDKPFLYDGIPFNAVGAARDETAVLQTTEQNAKSLQFVWCGNEKNWSKKELTAIAANDTADRIADLLNQAQQGHATLIDGDESRTLSGGDIAVLVRNHRQANEVQQCLRARGVNSVQQGRENVFSSAESIVIQRLILAVAEPSHDHFIAAVLMTPLFNLSAADLLSLQQDDNQWLSYSQLFHDCQQTWLKHGFVTMLRQLLAANQVQQRLLAQVAGERQLTNLLHLAELVQDYCNQHTVNFAAVSQWLLRQQTAAGEQETAQLRLESDEQLVKIITIHKSKGLEYPIVFCPFLWDVSLRSSDDDLLIYHDPAQDNAALVAVAEPVLSKAQDIVDYEQRAEDLRLLYVALTRARERCVLFWGNGKGVEDSALFSLLHPQQAAEADLMQQGLTELTRHHAESMQMLTWQQREMLTYQVMDDEMDLRAREFSGQVHAPWRVGSFSALTAGHDAELPDYDATTQPSMQDSVETRNEYDRFGFPKGAQAGTCLHSILEKWDFHDQQQLAEVSKKQLSIFGFDEKWLPVVTQWMSEIVSTPLLDDGLSLNQLQRQQRLDEMAFYFPVADLKVNSLQRALASYLGSDPALSEVIKRLKFYDLTGFMKGFIDLVFEHNGKFYVIDYKSNYLGSSAANYQQPQLEQAMLAHVYPLQYLIYTLALHRYLQLRLPDYDPHQHLGGVKYLFLRGMKAEWQKAGIYSQQVDADLLMALDSFMAGSDV